MNDLIIKIVNIVTTNAFTNNDIYKYIYCETPKNQC